MSNRTFFVARKETGEDLEPFDCGVYALTTGWSYAPLRMTSEDRAAFASRLAHGCDDWSAAQATVDSR